MPEGSRWRGVRRLVHDAVDATVALVDVGHESTARSVRAVTDQVKPLREPAALADDARRIGTQAVLGAVRVVNRGVEAVTDAILDRAVPGKPEPAATVVPAIPLRSDVTDSASFFSDAALGVVNAAVGDHLAETENGLDMSMAFRVADHYVALEEDVLRAQLPEPSPRVALFVHGLATSEWSWCLEAERYHGDPATHFGWLLERDLGFTSVFLRYNTGRRVPDSGRLLARELERFVDAYPVPIEDLTLIGHSMGGLVVRSACRFAEDDGRRWPRHVRRVFCLGSPHHGAPLAKLSRAVGDVLGRIDLPGTQIGARIISARSAGIKDLSDGDIVDDDWLAQHPDTLLGPDLLGHARHYFMSATITRDPDDAIGRLVGDMMVREPSASGAELRESHFPIATFRHGGVMHHQLQNHPAVYEQIRRACAEDAEDAEDAGSGRP